jgi:hypothetical protein
MQREKKGKDVAQAPSVGRGREGQMVKQNPLLQNKIPETQRHTTNHAPSPSKAQDRAVEIRGGESPCNNGSQTPL